MSLSLTKIKYEAVILVVTAVAFFPLFNAEFTNWDDPSYLLENTLVTDSSLRGFITIFTTYVEGNYHPITILSYWLEYNFFGYNPLIYHVVNLFFHVANSILVFHIAKKILNNSVLSLFSACLFALHPMHVESVAWISSRKDVLFAFFFLLSFRLHILNVGEVEKGKTLIKYIYFLLSLMCKAVAVTLPILFICYDFLVERKKTIKKILLTNIPGLFMSIIFGVIAIHAQKSFTAIQQYDTFSLWERFCFFFFNLYIYLKKFLLPLNLSNFHPYPDSLTVEYYIAILVVLLIVYLFFKFDNRLIRFSLLFYLITILPTSQIIPLGSALFAERYTYIPYVGVVILASFLVSLISHKHIRRAIIFITIFIFIFKTNAYSKVWKNSINLWSNMIVQYPNQSVGYSMRGAAHIENEEFTLALSDIETSLAIKGPNPDDLSNKASCLYENNMSSDAVKYYNLALKLDSNHIQSYNGRGNIKLEAGEYEPALKDFKKALQISPYFVDAMNNLGLTYLYLDKFSESKESFEQLILKHPYYYKGYFNLGNLYGKNQMHEKAMSYYEKTFEIEPSFADAYNNMGIVLCQIEKYEQATQYFSIAISNDTNYAIAYLNRGMAKEELRQYKEAMQDYSFCIKKDSTFIQALEKRANVYVILGDTIKSSADIEKIRAISKDIQ